MTNRTSQVTVKFSHAFVLPGFERPQPPGDYRIDYDEEQIEGVSWQVWRRTGAFIHLPAIAVKGSKRQMLPVDPSDLDTALKMDLLQI